MMAAAWAWAAVWVWVWASVPASMRVFSRYGDGRSPGTRRTKLARRASTSGRVSVQVSYRPGSHCAALEGRGEF